MGALGLDSPKSALLEDHLNGIDFGAGIATSTKRKQDSSLSGSTFEDIGGVGGQSKDTFLKSYSTTDLDNAYSLNGTAKGFSISPTMATQHEQSRTHGTEIFRNLLNSENQVMPIAIIGMSCRFPGGASNLEKFWQVISKGRPAWSKIPENRFNIDGFYHPNSDRSDCVNVKSGHFLGGTDFASFDAPFFNISPNEAKAMDPRARMHLEGAYEALENAGIPISDIAGSDTGVFVGAFNTDYGKIVDRDPGNVPIYKATGLGQSLFSNRISHWFDLKGPSMTVDTACSASMSALHRACDSIREGESKMAIVSGANLILDPDIMIALSTLKFLSPDGKTYMFDERANGYARGEGIGTLVIKPLSEALQHKDPVHAIIRNTRTNQDGRTPGITMPSQDAQRSLIEATYRQAGLDPSETDFFEAHGTGTQAGDRTEAEALANAFSSATRPLHQPLRVGSVKTVIGHCEGASGVAGIIHAVMALKNKSILPNANFEKPSHQIKFSEWNIKVPTKIQRWLSHHTRRVSVNSFGYGGSNVHAILEEAPTRPEVRPDHLPVEDGVNDLDSPWRLPTRPNRKILCLSANDVGGISRQANLLTDYIEQHRGSEEYTNDLVYTLGQRRSLLKHRLAVHGDTIQGLRSSLESLKKVNHVPSNAESYKNLAFIFTGQGAQWLKMGIELFNVYPVFVRTIRAADNHLGNLGALWSLLDEMARGAPDSSINEAYLSQPLCTALQIAMVDLLRSWNVTPVAVVGHSSGEIAAAYSAGMLSLESAMTVAYYRGQLSSQLNQANGLPKGAMLAVGLSAEEAQFHLGGIDPKKGEAAIACINSPKSVTVSGDVAAVDALASNLEAEGVFSRKLKVNVAYHSTHMTAIADSYSKSLQKLVTQPRDPRVSFCSSVYPGLSVETDGHYWVQNLLSTVRFSEAAKCMLLSSAARDHRIQACVEIGPNATLVNPFKQICDELPQEIRPDYAPSLLRERDGVECMVGLACSLFNHGLKVDIAAINFPHGDARNRVLTDLPPYPWNHSVQYWHEGRQGRNYRNRTHPPHDLLGVLSDDSTETDMRWTNYIRLSELPWLKDHVVRSEILFPGAAYLAMAVEAIEQKAVISDLRTKAYNFREVTFSKALVVPDTSDGVEVSLILTQFRQSTMAVSTSWHEFKIVSFGPDRKSYEHCHGLISISYDPYFDFSDSVEATLLATCKGDAMQPDPYDRILTSKMKDNEMGPCFRLITQYCAQNEYVYCNCGIPDNLSALTFGHQSPQKVSVPFLDSIFQVVLLSIAFNNTTTTQGATIPTSLGELTISTAISSQPSYECLARGSMTVLGPRDFLGGAIAAREEDGRLKPMIQ